MPRLMRVSLLALALLVIAGPAAAHVPTPPPPLATPEATPAAAIVPILSAAPTGPVLPWYLPAALALVVGAGWRRPRRALLVGLILLLSVFAFENALHSVHHGLDAPPPGECAVAALSAQLAAVEVDGAGSSSLARAVIGRVDTAQPPFALSRYLSPDQGRAPPSAIR